MIVVFIVCSSYIGKDLKYESIRTIILAMAKPVVFDVETKKSFAEIADRKPESLGISLAGAYSYELNEYRAFREHELEELFTWFERASVIIGYNSNGFDIPALQPYYVGNLMNLPRLDLLETIKTSLGRRIALDEFAKETLGAKKSGHGLMAINYFKQGKWDKLAQYCLDDVRITKELYEFGKQNGQVFFKVPYGRKAVKIDWHIDVNAQADIPLTLGI